MGQAHVLRQCSAMVVTCTNTVVDVLANVPMVVTCTNTVVDVLANVKCTNGHHMHKHCCRTVASSLEVVRPYCVVITTTPTFAHSLVQVPHKCGMAMAVPAL